VVEPGTREGIGGAAFGLLEPWQAGHDCHAHWPPFPYSLESRKVMVRSGVTKRYPDGFTWRGSRARCTVRSQGTRRRSSGPGADRRARFGSGGCHFGGQRARDERGSPFTWLGSGHAPRDRGSRSRWRCDLSARPGILEPNGSGAPRRRSAAARVGSASRRATRFPVGLRASRRLSHLGGSAPTARPRGVRGLATHAGRGDEAGRTRPSGPRRAPPTR
jgi:hypothetical protein